MFSDFFVHFQVPVGVIPKNEVKREEMVEIMDELQQKYTPCTRGVARQFLMVGHAKHAIGGVWGHAPPLNFEFRGLLRVYLVHSR